MKIILAVAIGGALGAMARYGLSVAAIKAWGSSFPYGTLIANVLGGFLMGVIVELFALKFDAQFTLRAFLTVGLLGGFTTFSAYSLEVVLMLERGQSLLALGYACGSALLAVLALFCGLTIIRWGFA